MEAIFSFLKKYYLSFKVRNGVLISLGLISTFFTQIFQDKPDKASIYSYLFLSLVNFCLVLFYNHYILRLFLFKKRIILFLLLFIAYMAFLTFFIMHGVPNILNRPHQTNYLSVLPDIIFNTILITLFYLFHYYFLSFIKTQDILILNNKNEINSLKQQLNPHFLLNSLNNLYGVSLTKPDEVPNKIIELSDLLKYQIEMTKRSYNSFLDEKAFIDKYIKYSNWKMQNIQISTFEEGELKDFSITPMLFLPLVENAIKYANYDKNPIIHIRWIFKNDTLSFSIFNTYKIDATDVFSSNNGLENLKTRLSLFHPDSNLEIMKKDNTFNVNLSLWNLNVHA